MGKQLHAAAAGLVLVAQLAWGQVATYDADTGVVRIPAVRAGTATFVDVTLKHRGNLVFDFTGGVGQKPAGPASAHYDLATGLLTLPAVKVGDATYLDVTLADRGHLDFELKNATALPQATVDDVKATVAGLDALWATAVPPTGAQRVSVLDACYLDNGRSRAWIAADADANRAAYQQRDAYAVGRRSINLQVLALRDQANPDGSRRREVDVQYDVVYRDGSTAVGAKTTLIGGSSVGSCATPQDGATMRFLGNRQLVQTAVRAVNYRDERYLLGSGAPASPAVSYRREMQFLVTDPMGNATYVIVSGLGPSRTVNGNVIPFSMKLLSPRIARAAPEMQGKSGNFLNWLDDDSFRTCRAATDSGTIPPVALVADCGGQGTQANVWGWGPTPTPDAAADAGFVAQGWKAGSFYRFDVYNDDGWKFANGHAGKVPIATYYAAVNRLPYTFAEMAGKYPLIHVGGLSTAQIAANAASATPALLSLAWTSPTVMADGRQHHLYQVWEFHQGAKAGNTGNAFNPAYRVLNRAYPGTMSTSTAAFPVSAKLPEQAGKTYTEYNLFFSDPTNFDTIQTRLSFQ